MSFNIAEEIAGIIFIEYVWMFLYWECNNDYWTAADIRNYKNQRKSGILRHKQVRESKTKTLCKIRNTTRNDGQINDSARYRAQLWEDIKR
jgi:hypothetical protein